MKSKILRLLLSFVLLGAFFSCSKEFNKLQKTGTVQDKYQAAIKYYENKDYYKAGVLFEELKPLVRGDSTAEKVHFYNAYCNFYQGLYQMSSYEFKSFYATYANSPLAEEAFYMHAYSMFKDSPAYNLDQASTLEAIDALQTFINTFPASEYAQKSAQNLIDLRHRLERKAYERAKLYYKTSGVTIANYKAAVIAIDNFKKDFPDSPYNEELSYIQLASQEKLAESTIFKLQQERFDKAIDLYQNFVDKYPESAYRKDALKSYEAAQKGIELVRKQQAEIDRAQADARAKQDAAQVGSPK